ncbi:hypothetical protein BABINDRAFT_103885 [Babjeviella inositovora NRRL Y-12698]|uniref:Uncharacterized protein n=1 Tax=Babjeviella inositovora NRRL Y-12698 TaxID=984486 RepID=A0A1E3QHS8_9ASCO|nr:uncharacterized protein BABINDRAFT_103885 [Babjeviella inositovora NRRL Y-12698]ODQ77246.1 hypothetical protein BABINDRAFT_103885 [Babjeviella inositovora NRRL Y-12698]
MTIPTALICAINTTGLMIPLSRRFTVSSPPASDENALIDENTHLIQSRRVYKRLERELYLRDNPPRYASRLFDELSRFYDQGMVPLILEALSATFYLLFYSLELFDATSLGSPGKLLGGPSFGLAFVFVYYVFLTFLHSWNIRWPFKVAELAHTSSMPCITNSQSAQRYQILQGEESFPSSPTLAISVDGKSKNAKFTVVDCRDDIIPVVSSITDTVTQVIEIPHKGPYDPYLCNKQNVVTVSELLEEGLDLTVSQERTQRCNSFGRHSVTIGPVLATLLTFSPVKGHALPVYDYMTAFVERDTVPKAELAISSDLSRVVLLEIGLFLLLLSKVSTLFSSCVRYTKKERRTDVQGDIADTWEYGEPSRNLTHPFVSGFGNIYVAEGLYFVTMIGLAISGYPAFPGILGGNSNPQNGYKTANIACFSALAAMNLGSCYLDFCGAEIK